MYNRRKVIVIIGAAGSGKRMRSRQPKQFLKIGNKTILETTAEKFITMPETDEIVIVSPAGYIDDCCRFFAEKKYGNRISVICGGKERQDSVENAIEFLKRENTPGDSIVLIHDGVRPYVTERVILDVIKETADCGAAVAAVPTRDTIRHIHRGTLNRGELYNVQTPQGFTMDIISEAFEKARIDGFYGTDDAGLAERCGYNIRIVPGDEGNIKITTPEDLKVENRIGTGYDVHRLGDNRKLILGGVEIPFEKGLVGHSDADVLIHALMDAMLGAAAKGDIGKLFPDTDDRFAGISSIILLKRVKELLSSDGYSMGNADMTIICQKPKLADYIPQMERNIAKALETDVSRISIKATTTEKLGFAGRQEGIAAEAVCLLNR